MRVNVSPRGGVLAAGDVGENPRSSIPPIVSDELGSPPPEITIAICEDNDHRVQN
jgi:hypothetical protein